jgi:hypothetical protein
LTLSCLLGYIVAQINLSTPTWRLSRLGQMPRRLFL